MNQPDQNEVAQDRYLPPRNERTQQLRRITAPPWPPNRDVAELSAALESDGALLERVVPESKPQPQQATNLAFPESGMVGWFAIAARELVKGTEVSAEFCYAGLLTVIGSMCSPDLTVSVGLEVDTRFYTVLLGESADSKKSSALRKVIEFCQGMESPRFPSALYGIGSGEGLAKHLARCPVPRRMLLAFDEFRAFLDKTKIEGSSLLSLVTLLYEGHCWDNVTRGGDDISVRDAHLSLIGCATRDTYGAMWTSDALAIGFPNRLFVVWADRSCRVAIPSRPDSTVLDEARREIGKMFKQLPKEYSLTEEAKRLWTVWYNQLPSGVHIKRLDVLGWRVMSLLALSLQKTEIDGEVVRATVAILDYELRIRILTDPVDADNKIAALEERIRRTLKVRGKITRNQLRQSVHADRQGIWAFEQAMRNLANAKDIVLGKDGLIQGVTQ